MSKTFSSFRRRVPFFFLCIAVQIENVNLLEAAHQRLAHARNVGLSSQEWLVITPTTPSLH